MWTSLVGMSEIYGFKFRYFCLLFPMSVQLLAFPKIFSLFYLKGEELSFCLLFEIKKGFFQLVLFLLSHLS
jgi:hypothetical protein